MNSYRSGLLALLLVAALPGKFVATDRPVPNAGGQHSQPALRCEPPTLGRDKLTVVCTLDAAAPQAVGIKVHLTGSHDDTTASMEVALGDAPVACDIGSKLSTEAEDGDVTLDCRFTASPKPGAGTVLRVAAKWFHAQYVNHEMQSRRP